MSKAAPLIIIMLLVGGIALWGFLTDWTFSGLLPREGARCTPDEDSKDENAKEYVYDEDEECTFIQSCKTNWKPNSSNTACIAETTGDECTVSNPDPNGTYRYDTRGVCVLDSCGEGYQKSGTECTTLSGSTGDECSVTNPVDHGVYKLDTNGVCVLDSCVPGYEESDGVCVSGSQPGSGSGSGSQPDPFPYAVGTSIMCTANDVGEGEDRAVYRYVGDGKLRYYPDPTIAASWGVNGPDDYEKIDCDGLTLLNGRMRYNGSIGELVVCNDTQDGYIIKENNTLELTSDLDEDDNPPEISCEGYTRV